MNTKTPTISEKLEAIERQIAAERAELNKPIKLGFWKQTALFAFALAYIALSGYVVLWILAKTYS